MWQNSKGPDEWPVHIDMVRMKHERLMKRAETRSKGS